MYDAYEEGRGCIDNVHSIVGSDSSTYIVKYSYK